MTQPISDDTESAQAEAALRLMNQALSSLSPAQRDERLQIELARSMTPETRFERAAAIYDFLLGICSKERQASDEF